MNLVDYILYIIFRHYSCVRILLFLLVETIPMALALTKKNIQSLGETLLANNRQDGAMGMSSAVSPLIGSTTSSRASLDDLLTSAAVGARHRVDSRHMRVISEPGSDVI